MYLKKVLLSMAVVGVSSLTFAFSQHSFQQIEGLAQKTYQVQNLIGFEQASAIIKQKTQGTIIGATLKTDEGAPHYEYIILEQQQMRVIHIHAELGKVLADKTVGTDTPAPFYTPAVNLSDAIASAESELAADIVVAELDQHPLHPVYRLVAMFNQVIFEVTVSADTGKLLTIESMEDDWSSSEIKTIEIADKYFMSAKAENSYMSPRQARP